MKLKTKLFTLFLFLVVGFLSKADNIKEREQHIINNFILQSNLFPQEKIHLHLDRTSYLNGEKIWCKAYVVNGLSHEPMTLSRYVYVELVNPNNVVVRRIKVKESDGQYYGHIDIPESLPGGYYSIRAYTNFMYNLGEDYFYRSTVNIQNPESWRYSIRPEFNYKNANELECRLNIDLASDKKINLKDFDIRLENQHITNLKLINNTTVQFSVKLGKDDRIGALYIGYHDYREFINIPLPENDFDVSFFPEGGNLVAKKKCKVAFKSLSSAGMPQHVTGVIKDGEGNIVAEIETQHKGMGFFYLNADADKSYTAHVETEGGLLKTFELPKVDIYAESLQVEYREELISVSVNNNSGKPDRYIFAHSRGYPLYFGKYVDKQIHFSKDGGFPSGVIHILLLDTGYNVLSERLLFSKTDDHARTMLKLNKKAYKKRDRVMLDIDVSADNTFDYTDLSVSVVDKVFIDSLSSVSIFSTLLLTSDLKGYISNPDYYFQKNNPKAEQELDLLMLVHGWRRYNIPEVLKGNFREPTEPLEVGQEISGKVRSLVRKRGVENSDVSIISTERSFFHQAMTNEEGEFFLKSFEFPDSTEFVIQALNINRKQNVELMIYETEYPDINLSVLPDIAQLYYKNNLREKLPKELHTIPGIRMIDLDEVAVRAVKPEFQKGYMSDFADNSFTLKDIEEIDATCLHELFRRIPGVEVRDENLYIRGRTSIYGDSKAAIFIDGIYMDGDFDLHLIQMPDVARVDLFKTGSTNVFGSIGGSGVLSITTKDGSYIPPDKPQFNIKRFIPLGYQTPIEFYSPKYDTAAKRNRAELDKRTTILWKPDLKTDDSGKASCEFYTADFPTSYTVIIEGVTSEGQLVREVEKIVVE